MNNKEKVLKDYLDFKKLSVHSSNKLEDLKRYTRRFLESYKQPIEKTTEKDVINFLNSIDDFSISHKNNLKIYLKNFIKWYFVDYSTRFRNIDKICRNEKPEPSYSSSEMLSIPDVEKLIQGENDPYWKAYFLVLFYGGFRPIEVDNLKWTDVSFTKDGLFIKIYSQKNKREFEKYLPDNVSFYLKKQQNNNSDYIFPSHTDIKKPIGRKTSYFRLRNLSLKVLNKKISPYILRHSIATLLYNRDDLKDDLVSIQMGHSKSMKNTYSHLSKDKQREKIKKIWLHPEDLPPEKKHQLEQEVIDMKKDLNSLKEMVLSQNKLIEKFQKISKKP